jgi:hypothetical protein
MKNVAFYSGVGFLFAHELDAVANHEWRVLPLTSWLSEELGQIVFVGLHVPVFAFLVAIVSSENENTRLRSRFWVSVFLVVHGILHTGFAIHPEYEFESVISSVLIYGGAACGLVYLWLNRKRANA